MSLLECSAMQLKRLSKRNKTIFFGAGRHLVILSEIYSDLHVEKNVAYIIDNNAALAGKSITLNGVDIEVKKVDALIGEDLSKTIVVITSTYYEEMYAQLAKLYDEKELRCYVYPMRRYAGTKYIHQFFTLLSKKAYIVLIGEGTTCENAVAMGDYIRKKAFWGKYKLVWLCAHPDKFKDSKNEIYLNINSNKAKSLFETIRHYNYVGRAKFLLFENSTLNKYRKDQISVYMNHGSPPIKATKGIIVLPEDVTYAVSPSDFSSKIISEQYSVDPRKIIVCGSPRTDSLFEQTIHQKMAEYLKLKEYDKILLWAPTFRQLKKSTRNDIENISETGLPVLSSIHDFDELQEYLKEKNVLLLIKLHLLQDDKFVAIRSGSNIRILTNDDMDGIGFSVFDLMKGADALISDYSTIAFDYMLLDRPIGYAIDNNEGYKLGFSVGSPMELMPGEIIHTPKEFIHFVESVTLDKDDFADKRHAVNQLVHKYPDGNNCMRLSKMIGIET